LPTKHQGQITSEKTAISMLDPSWALRCGTARPLLNRRLT
jgi:hypothetical protein